MPRQITRAVALILLLLQSYAAPGARVSLDFNDLPAGANLTGQYSQQGATFSLIPSPAEPGSPLPPPSGPTVWSLGPVDQLGVNGNSILVGPTTTGPFYDGRIDFSSPIDYLSIVALDAESLPLLLTAYSQGTALPLSFTSTFLGNIGQLPYVSGPTWRLELGSIGGPIVFDRVVFGRTEQFDNLQYNTVVPLPAAAWFIAPAIALLAPWVRRRASA